MFSGSTAIQRGSRVISEGTIVNSVSFYHGNNKIQSQDKAAVGSGVTPPDFSPESGLQIISSIDSMALSLLMSSSSSVLP